MRWAAIALLGACAGISAGGWAGNGAGAQQLPQGVKDPPLRIPGVTAHDPLKDAVRFVSPYQVTVAARRPAIIDLKFHVADGLHINSHVPHEKTLIPTRLMVVEEKQGADVSAIDFPPGTDYSLAFAPDEKLSVYTGDFTLRAHVIAQRGEHSLQGSLRYQACDVNSCMPPRNLQFSVNLVAR
jgi:Disulphide bond corrector protein DsbC